MSHDIPGTRLFDGDQAQKGVEAFQAEARSGGR